MKLRKWLIKKIVGNEPVVMNVSIFVDGEVDMKASKPGGIFEKCYIGPKAQ